MKNVTNQNEKKLDKLPEGKLFFASKAELKISQQVWFTFLLFNVDDQHQNPSSKSLQCFSSEKNTFNNNRVIKKSNPN